MQSVLDSESLVRQRSNCHVTATDPFIRNETGPHGGPNHCLGPSLDPKLERVTLSKTDVDTERQIVLKPVHSIEFVVSMFASGAPPSSLNMARTAATGSGRPAALTTASGT